MDSNNQTPLKIEKEPSMSVEKTDNLEISSVKADEQAIEKVVETEAAVLEAGVGKGQTSVAAPITAAAVPSEAQVAALEKDQITVEVENILEKGLKDVYGNLPDNLKPLFKAKGEETANAISQMIKRTTVKIGDIMKLIFNWLRMIPGVNRFFLEQQAKIKADQILVLTDEINKEKNVTQ